MTIPPESIEAGKCYLADRREAPQVWRVVRIWPDGRVQFEFRSRTQRYAKLWKPEMLEGAAFAASAQREVPCDWTPDWNG